MSDQGLGGTIRKRTLHFIWLVDCSGSMAQDDHAKISALNNAVRECLPVLRDAAAANSVRILMRALAFSTGCHWHIAEPTPIDEVQWSDLTAAGRTDLGAGSIVLLHDIHQASVDAVPELVRRLRAEGYTLVTIPQLLGRTEPGTVYTARGSKR